MTHQRLKKDYEGLRHLQCTCSDDSSDSDSNEIVSDVNSVESDDRRLDMEFDEIPGPQLAEEPAEVRPQRQIVAPDRYGFGRTDLRTALENEQAVIEL